MPKLIASVEPDNEQYRQSEEALVKYIALAKQQQQSGAQPLPQVGKPLTVGGNYPAATELQARLQLEGDLPGAAQPQPTEAVPVRPASTGPQAAGLKGKLQGALKAGKKKVGLASKPVDSPKESAPARPQPEAAQALPPVYTQELADGVSHYEARHGYTVDGKLTPAGDFQPQHPHDRARGAAGRLPGALALAAERVRERAPDGESAGVHAARF